MNFLELTKTLSETFPIWICSVDAGDGLQDIAFLDDTQKSWHSNTLYFGYDKQLGTQDSLPSQCILASEDFSDMEQVSSLAPFPVHPANTAYIRPEDLFSVFNLSKTLVESTRNRGLYEELAALADRSRSLESVLNEAAVRLSNPLIFCDTAFKIISVSTVVPVKDVLWQENIRQGYCSYDFIQAVKNLTPVRHAAQTTRAIEVTCSESPYRKISSKVFHNGVQIGFLLMIEENSHLLPSHLEMVSTVSHALTYTISHYQQDLVQGISPYQQVLYEMLIGTPAREIHPKLHKLSFPPAMAAVFLRPTQYLGQRHLKEQTAPHLKALLPGTHVTYHKNGISALVPAETSGILPEKIKQALESFCIQEHVRAGISNSFASIGQFAFYTEQAIQALALGHRVSPEKSVLCYMDYQIFDLLAATRDLDALGRFCHPALALLRCYDMKNNTQLYQTLGTYLACGGSIKDTSARMFIHRNSLVYRINRIEEVCQMKLSDPDTCLLLRISYCIDQFNGLDEE